MARQPWPDEAGFNRIIAELAQDNERAKAIVGGSLLDFGLTEVISSRLRSGMSESDLNALFGDGAFGTCSQKIDAAYALGLFGPQTRRDMRIINKIRNAFAHSMRGVSFSDTAIADGCRDMTAGTNSDAHIFGEWAQKFVLAVQLIVNGLMLESIIAPALVLATSLPD